MNPMQGQQAPSYEAQMLEYARRQTSAIESLRAFAWGWSVALVISLAIAIQAIYG